MIQNPSRYFLARYEHESIERRQKAKAILIINATLILFAAIYTVLALIVIGKPFMGVITVIGMGFSLLALIMLRKGNYDAASTMLIYLFWASITILAVMPVMFQDRPVAIITRNTLLVFFLIVLFGEKRFQLLSVFALNLSLLLATHVPAVVSLYGGEPTAIDYTNLANELIILILAFTLASFRMSVTVKTLKEEKQRTLDNQRKFEELERLFVTNRTEMEIGGTLLALSEKTTGFIERLKGRLAGIGTGIEQLSGELVETEKKNGQMGEHTGEVKRTVLTQNAAISQQASSVEEISQSVRNVSSVSSKKRSAVDSLTRTTSTGIERMTESVSSIEKANRSSAGILEIIDVINDIADRTNILAMNAAIEAAHAGEFGKGFAVVADEIRNLAEQTSENTRNIIATLRENIENTDQASEKSSLAGRDFEQVHGEVVELAGTLEEIIATMEEVGKGAGEMLTNVTHLTDLSGNVTSSMGEMEQVIDRNITAFDRIMNTFGEIRSSIEGTIDNLLTEFDEVARDYRTIESLGNRNVSNMEAIFREIEVLKSHVNR